MQVEGPLLFRLLLLAMLVLFVAHRAYYNAKTSGDEKEVLDQKDDGWVERFAGTLVIIALVSSATYIVKPAWMRWSSVPIPVYLRWGGAALAAVGFVLLQWSHVALGQFWSDRPQIASDHELIQSGPYKRIRHPIYTSFLLILSAPLFITGNWFLGLTWILGTAIDIAKRIEYEEHRLESLFGEEYRRYREQTGALLPKF